MNITNDIKKEIFKKLQDPSFYADDEPITYTNDTMSKYANNQAHDVNNK